MVHPLMTTLEPLSITGIEPLQGPAQIGLCEFHQQMIVVWHQDVTMQPLLIPLGGLRQQNQNVNIIFGGQKDGAPVVD